MPQQQMPFPVRRDPLAAPDGTTPKNNRLLAILTVSIVLSILGDRLIVSWPDIAPYYSPWFDVFWLIVLVAVSILFYRKAHRSLMWCFTTLATAILCILATIWHFTTHNYDDGPWMTTVLLAIPCLLMMALQLSDGAYDMHHPWRTIRRWLLGWLSPFTQLGSIGSAFHHAKAAIRTFNGMHDQSEESNGDTTLASPMPQGQNKQGESNGMSSFRRIMLIIVVAVPLLAVLTALLASSDIVFKYALDKTIGSFDIGDFITHVLVVLVAFPFCTSVLLQTEVSNRLRVHALDPSRPDNAQAAERTPKQIDTFVATVVLALVLALYAFFCAIQFVYLFSGRQLPDGYTYSRYAREGFFQLLVVVCINLAGYALVLCRVRRSVPMNVMLVVLLAETGAILASAKSDRSHVVP